MNGDKLAQVLAVLAVAVVAGIVSFSHIETLALAHGYTLGTARLLPVSVDGLIVAASLACLTEARARGEASRLSRSGLVLGILATLAANVAVGAQFGLVGAIVNAWPAIAFIVASEILLRMLRAAPDLPSAARPPRQWQRRHLPRPWPCLRQWRTLCLGRQPRTAPACPTAAPWMCLHTFPSPCPKWLLWPL